MKLDKENMKKIRHLILFAIIMQVALSNLPSIFRGLEIFWEIIFPFVLGVAIAFVLNVPMRVLEEKIFYNRHLREKKFTKKIARPVSLILTIVVVFGVLLAVLFIVIPELGRTLQSLVNAIQDFIPQAERTLEELTINNQELSAWIEKFDSSMDEVLEKISSYIQNYAGSILNLTVSAITDLISGVANLVIAFVFACYILIQKEKLSMQIKKMLYAYLPEKRVEGCLEVYSLTTRSFSNFLTGQCVEALILGGMFFVAMNIFNMPYALLISVIVSFMALIPVFGAFVACIIGAFMILMVDPLQAVAFVIMFLILQQIEGNVIYPKVVGNSVGLPSIWVLACVTIGGKLMGVMGMIIFIPIASVIYSLVRTSVNRRLKERNIKIRQDDRMMENK